MTECSGITGTGATVIQIAIDEGGQRAGCLKLVARQRAPSSRLILQIFCVIGPRSERGVYDYASVSALFSERGWQDFTRRLESSQARPPCPRVRSQNGKPRSDTAWDRRWTKRTRSDAQVKH